MGTSAKDVKNRIKSVENTMHITKAMELVASSKLKKAKERMDRSRAYFDIMRKALSDIAARDGRSSSVFINPREIDKKCFVIIAGDRGLAGGYNNNVFKLALSQMDTDCCFLPIGKRSYDFCLRNNFEILSEDFIIVDTIGRKECAKIGKLLTKEYAKDAFDDVHIFYTHFDSMLSQSAVSISILPLSPAPGQEQENGFVLYEPGMEAVFNAIVPEYVAGLVYGAVCESYASELAARRTAMDSASKNAEKMIEDLSLKYNRARQNAITQEITEIVAGAEG